MIIVMYNHSNGTFIVTGGFFMSFRRESGYAEAEKEKFDLWISEQDNPTYGVYIISGDQFWKNELVDGLARSLKRRPEIVGEDLKKYTDKMRYRSITRKRHFILFESKNERLRSDDMDTLVSYFNEPSENGVLVVSLKDKDDKRYFLNTFKMIRKSRKIKFFEMDFVSAKFKSLMVYRKLSEYSFRFENEKLKKKAIKNLSMRMGSLVDNLDTLAALEMPVIGKDEFKLAVEEYGDASSRRLYESLSLLNRKKVPYEVLNEMVEDGMNPNLIMFGIRKHFVLLYQAKMLKMRGILRANDNEDVKKDLYLSEGITFKGRFDIWEIPKFVRDRYLEECEGIPLQDIIWVLSKIEEYYTTIRVRKGDDYKYTKFISMDKLYEFVMVVMDRRK